MRFSPLERGDQDASNCLKELFLQCCLNFAQSIFQVSKTPCFQKQNFHTTLWIDYLFFPIIIPIIGLIIISERFRTSDCRSYFYVFHESVRICILKDWKLVANISRSSHSWSDKWKIPKKSCGRAHKYTIRCVVISSFERRKPHVAIFFRSNVIQNLLAG